MFKFANRSFFPYLEYCEPYYEMGKKYHIPKIVTGFERHRRKKEVINELLNICFDELTDCQKYKKKLPS